MCYFAWHFTSASVVTTSFPVVKGDLYILTTIARPHKYDQKKTTFKFQWTTQYKLLAHDWYLAITKYFPVNVHSLNRYWHWFKSKCLISFCSNRGIFYHREHFKTSPIDQAPCKWVTWICTECSGYLCFPCCNGIGWLSKQSLWHGDGLLLWSNPVGRTHWKKQVSDWVTPKLLLFPGMNIHHMHQKGFCSIGKQIDFIDRVQS